MKLISNLLCLTLLENNNYMPRRQTAQSINQSINQSIRLYKMDRSVGAVNQINNAGDMDQ